LNKPVSGSTYRKLGVAIEELKVRPQITPNMTVRVNEGSYYTSRMKLVEFEGGTSPTIQAPAAGYKWVIVGITPQGTIFVSSGEIKNRAPELPTIERNMLPLAAIYLGANATAITEDMIEDIRPFLASGYHPGDHTLLDNNDAPNLHPIASIDGLQAALDDKASKADLERFSDKIDETSGTSSTTFTLNNAQSGTPTANAGIIINRGSELNVGIRYNERKNGGMWEFTNDGVVWNDFPTALSIDGSLKKASKNTDGVLRLSVEPEDILMPIAVGDNDPRLARIAEKVDKETVYTKEEIDEKFNGTVKLNEIYTRAAVDDMLDGKLNVGSTYTELQIDNFLRGKLNVGDAYTKDEVDNLLADNANLENTYTKEEVDGFVSEINGKVDGNTDAIETKANATDVYTKEEIDATNEETTNRLNALDEAVAAKAVAENVYTKEEVDNIVSEINTTVETNTSNIETKANAADVYTKAEVDEFIEAKVDDGEFDELEDAVTTLSNNVNSLLTEVAPTIVTQTEYQKDCKDVQDALDAINEEISGVKTTTYVKEETDEKVDTVVGATLEELNIVLNDIVEGTHSIVRHSQDASDVVTSTNELLRALGEKQAYKVDVEEAIATAKQETKADTIAEVKATTVQEAIAENANGLEIANIASKADVAEVQSNVTTLGETVDTKANASDVYTKDEVVSLLEAKANLADVYKKVDTYSAERIQELLDLEANKDSVYTIAQVDEALALKADKTEIPSLVGYAKESDVDDALALKADKTDLDVKANTSDVNDALALKADKTEIPSLEPYATVANVESLISEIDEDLAKKANSEDVYTKAEIDSSMDDKADTDTVYTKEEVDALLANMYTKEEVNQAISTAIADVLQQIRSEING